MDFGKTVGTACASFAITNIDDIFVLITFFAEASTSQKLTPLKITIGQYIGLTVIVGVSMIGYGLAQAIPAEPIGFLGLLPLLVGVYRLLDALLPSQNLESEELEKSKYANIKSVLKVSAITIMNGGDNIGTYTPLLSQAKGAQIAVYIVVYYILLGVWCLAAFLLFKQKHILRVFQKFSRWGIPFLYLGLGIYIIVKSDCYPWSIKRIDDSFFADPGTIVLGVTTAVLLSTCIGAMVWYKIKRRAGPSPNLFVDHVSLEERTSATGETSVDGSRPPGHVASATGNSTNDSQTSTA